METWKEKALIILRDSLFPVPIELNELDWKSGCLQKQIDWLNIFVPLPICKVVVYLLVYGVNNNGSCSQ
jgi:hypothetical protein